MVAPFDEGKEILSENRYEIISLEEDAKLRIQEGAKASISLNGNWVREGVVYVPNKGIYLTKNSPIIANAKQAVNCHRKGQDFYLTDEQVEQSLQDFVKLTFDAIPINRFGEDPRTIHAFGKVAEKYGQFLKENEINEMPIWLANMQDKPFARQVWFGRLGVDGRSGLGCVRLLHIGDRVRGGKGAEGTVEKLENYTPSQIIKVFQKLQISELEKSVMTELRNL